MVRRATQPGHFRGHVRSHVKDAEHLMQNLMIVLTVKECDYSDAENELTRRATELFTLTLDAFTRRSHG